MPSEVGAVAGTKLFIGEAADTIPPESPNPWTEIKELANIGNLGTTFSKIAVESVGSGYTRQIKGTQSAPAFSLTINRKDDDPGQIALLEASADRNSFFPFKLRENDGSYITFLGRVFGFTRNYGGVTALKQLAGDIEVEPDSVTYHEAP